MRNFLAQVTSVLLLSSGSMSATWPDPARFEKAIFAFEEADKLSLPAPGALVATGSSSIRMWHDHILQDLAPLPIIPRGFGGSNMNDLLAFAHRIILPYAPRAVLVYEGDNDIQSGMAPKDVLDSFIALEKLIHYKLPNCKIYFISIKPSPSRWEKWPQMRETNALIKKFCGRRKTLGYLDVATPMLDSSGQPRPELFIEDKLHMNREGYAVWTGVIKPALMKEF